MPRIWKWVHDDGPLSARAGILEVGSIQGETADEVDVAAVSALRAAVQERSAAERHIVEAVRQARGAGLSWAAIGRMVGTSGEAARQCYAKKVA